MFFDLSAAPQTMELGKPLHLSIGGKRDSGEKEADKKEKDKKKKKGFFDKVGDFFDGSSSSSSSSSSSDEDDKKDKDEKVSGIHVHKNYLKGNFLVC